MTRASLPALDRNANVGDVAFWSRTGDRGGWYRLDGRATSTLSARAKKNAATLGFSANLPDAAGCIPVDGMGAAGALGGVSTVTLTKANLPAITYTGTTPSGGAHTHSFNRDLWRKNGDNPPRDSANSYAAGSTSTPSVTGANNFHSHTITAASGGSGTAIAVADKNLAGFLFVYLGG